MQQIETIAGLRAAVAAARASGAADRIRADNGCLHEGHLRLVDDARRLTGYVVMSLFVNPTQFGPNEDFSRYPRDLSGNGAKAKDRGVDLFFVPQVSEIYPGDAVAARDGR